MNTCVMVLGMHRSGTSAITGALEKLGIALHQKLLESNSFNPKGYFEGVDVTKLNDSLLLEMGSNWDDTRFPTHIPEDLIEKYLPEATKLIEREFAYTPIFAMKDPRFCVTFPVWELALKKLKIDLKIIFPYRNPLEIARSLRQRDGFSHEKSILLWAKHLLLSERYSREYPRHFINYSSFLKDPIRELNEIAEVFSIELDLESMNEIRDSFLDPTLRHHTSKGMAPSKNTPEFIQSLATYVKNNSLYEVPHNDFDALYNEFKSIYTFMDDSDVQLQSSLSRSLYSQRDHATAEAKRLVTQSEERNITIQNLREENEALEGEKLKLLNKVPQLEIERNRLSDQINTHTTKINRLSAQNNTLSDQIFKLSNRNDRLKDELDKLQKAHANSMSTKEQQIKELLRQLEQTEKELRSTIEHTQEELDIIKEINQIKSVANYKLEQDVIRLETLMKEIAGDLAITKEKKNWLGSTKFNSI